MANGTVDIRSRERVARAELNFALQRFSFTEGVNLNVDEKRRRAREITLQAAHRAHTQFRSPVSPLARQSRRARKPPGPRQNAPPR
jgi:hypothetical protein